MNVKMLVSVSGQSATLFIDGAPRKKYVISTALKGTGSEAESNRTPLGLLRVSEKFGDGMAIGTVFKDRIPTGQIWQPGDEGENLILTRILWLEGCEPHNANTKDRYIYLHGTRNESKLGTPISQGCIVFGNKDIVEVFDLMPVGAYVEVVP
jgi:hypothetical protein